MSDDDKTFLEPVEFPDIHAHCRQRITALEQEVEQLRAQLARGVAHARERVALVGDLAEANAEIERLRALLREACEAWHEMDWDGRMRVHLTLDWQNRAARAAGGDS